MGDDDQSIYGWRGAEVDNILRFEKDFPGAKVIKLERNYRCTQNILDVSGALIAHNINRRGKRLWTDSGAGAKVDLYKASEEGDEARWVIETIQALRRSVKLGDMGVLVRTNAQTRAIEDELLAREIPYSLVGGVRFYDLALCVHCGGLDGDGTARRGAGRHDERERLGAIDARRRDRARRRLLTPQFNRRVGRVPGRIHHTRTRRSTTMSKKKSTTRSADLSVRNTPVFWPSSISPRTRSW